jgi:hypothetical protein
VAVAHRIIDAAGAFDSYVRRASAIKADFRDGLTVAHAVEMGGVYEPNQLEQGAIAYAALVALQDRNFVLAVQDVARDPGRRAAFAAHLLAQPDAVLGAAAARKAAARVALVLGRMGAQVAVAGVAVNQAAYDVQRQDWSRDPVEAADQHLARIKAQSAVQVSLLPAETEQLIGSLAAFRGAEDETAEIQKASALITRGMALAALAILGRAGEDDVEAVTSLMTDPDATHCIGMAKLDFFQCLSVAGPHYENLACLGRHGLMQTGRCIASASGMTEVALLTPASAPERRSVMVPLAGDEPQTLERDSVLGRQPAPAAGPAADPGPSAR